MIVGIGIDLVDLDHMLDVLNNQPRIYKRILTEAEIVLYNQRSDKGKIEFLAGRFAAKEAFGKAMGTGIGKVVNFQSISILNDEKGTPIVIESPFYGNIFISISHSKYSAVAQIVLETA